jgi:hypothetical protein
LSLILKPWWTEHPYQMSFFFLLIMQHIHWLVLFLVSHFMFWLGNTCRILECIDVLGCIKITKAFTGTNTQIGANVDQRDNMLLFFWNKHNETICYYYYLTFCWHWALSNCKLHHACFRTHVYWIKKQLSFMIFK